MTRLQFNRMFSMLPDDSGSLCRSMKVSTPSLVGEIPRAAGLLRYLEKRIIKDCLENQSMSDIKNENPW